MDASRTEPDFLCRCVESAIKAGATTINIPDTVGYAYPEEFADLIREITNNVPNIDQAVISVHCHNDLGLAVANSLARRSRPGRGRSSARSTASASGPATAALEEVVMAMQVRGRPPALPQPRSSPRTS